MTISMYQASVPRIVNMLTNLNHLLAKAHAHVESKKWNEAALTQFRLYPDMLPLTRQVQIACEKDRLAFGQLKLRVYSGDHTANLGQNPATYL